MIYKFLLGTMLILANTLLHAQQEPFNDNNVPIAPRSQEIRFNAYNFILGNSINLDYEYLISEDTSAGISVLVNLTKGTETEFIRNYSFAPYFRYFFSRKYAKGFFVEGFAMLLNRDDTLQNPDGREFGRIAVKETTAALGFALGGKFVTKGGFVAELFTGLGRTLWDTSNEEEFLGELRNFVTRGGISLGYRF